MKKSTIEDVRKQAPVSILEGKYLRFVNKGGWEYVERVNCTGVVVIVALTKTNKVLFTEQYRPAVDKNVVEFPAGLVNDEGIKKKESFAAAAKRELREETGYQAKRIVKLIDGPISGGLTSEFLTFVRAYDVRKRSRGGGDKNERITVHAIALEKSDQWLKGMRKKGHLVDPKVYSGLYFLKSLAKA